MRSVSGNRLRQALLPAAACVLVAGLLWGAMSERGGLPDGWVPVNESVEAAVAGEGAAEGETSGTARAPDAGDSASTADAGGAAGAPDERDEPVVGEASEGAANPTGASGAATGETPAGDAEAAADAGSAPAAADDGLLDLNAASAAELDALPGIGPAKAQAIVADRAANGPFGTVEELTRVKGIGDKMLDKLRPHIKVTDGERNL